MFRVVTFAHFTLPLSDSNSCALTDAQAKPLRSITIYSALPSSSSAKIPRRDMPTLDPVSIKQKTWFGVMLNTTLSRSQIFGFMRGI